MVKFKRYSKIQISDIEKCIKLAQSNGSRCEQHGGETWGRIMLSVRLELTKGR